MPATVGARELKTRLGRYLRRVRRGETLLITDRREPVAELRPVTTAEDPMTAALEQLSARGGLTLPSRQRPSAVRPARLSGGSGGAAAVSADRDERG